MKRKNLALAMIAAVFAVGGAFATALTIQPVFVKGYLTSSPTTLRCINTNLTCDDAGTFPCSVRLSVQSGPDVASSAPSATNKVYRDVTTCAIAIPASTTDAIQQSGLSIDRLQFN
jgi:hypothetical protein